MLDFASTRFDGVPSPQAAEQAPVNDQALLDAYSNAVIGVTDRVGPAVVRVETGPKARNPRERGGLGSGIVISPDGLVLTNDFPSQSAFKILRVCAAPAWIECSIKAGPHILLVPFCRGLPHGG